MCASASASFTLLMPTAYWWVANARPSISLCSSNFVGTQPLNSILLTLDSISVRHVQHNSRIFLSSPTYESLNFWFITPDLSWCNINAPLPYRLTRDTNPDFFFNMHIALQQDVGPDARLQVSDFETFSKTLIATLADSPTITTKNTSPDEALRAFLALPCVVDFLVRVSRADVFSEEAARNFSGSSQELALLRSYKLLKYCYNLPCGQMLSLMAGVVASFELDAAALRALADRVLADKEYSSLFIKRIILAKDTKGLPKEYSSNADYLLKYDPHALYPTSIYRQCFGHVSSSEDSRIIEGVMGTTITTTIEIVRDVLKPSSHQLRDVYKSLGRCIAVIDKRLDGLYGDDLANYFNEHEIHLEKLVYRCMEVDKDISTVEQILVDLKTRRVSRNEPVLVVGGGVMADVGGFACALYHRNTPYVMLCTSIVSGIDAGPSPRTCCDGLGYKNVFGAYHPPVLTLTDRQFFRTLRPGWIRHGIAEIIKMAVTKDACLFDAVEQAGNRLVETKFGVECERGSDIDGLAETIIAKAMDGYVRAEYGNLWETHQCRPHAYGHTWSPGFELQAGLLHGHAVAIGMGYGAYMSHLEGWLSEENMHRIFRVISSVGLSLRHAILDNINSVWSAQVKMTEKRGGNLCAPVPFDAIGTCGYINDVSRERLEQTLSEYQELVRKYPREGLGVEPHCADVGLEDPSTVKQHADNAISKDDGPELDKAKTANGSVGAENGKHGDSNGNCEESAIDKYNAWISGRQASRGPQSSSVVASKISSEVAVDTEEPPTFPHDSLFHDDAEEYAANMTTLSSDDYVTIAEETKRADLYAPCMVGKVEGQFLKMITQIKGAKRILDIGTFTGYSALAFAEGSGDDGEVVTLEADAKTATIARKIFETSANGRKIKLIEGDARVEITRMADSGEKFDIIFLDADKTNYRHYYEAGILLLNDNGLLMADNALCSLVYAENDPARVSLHNFAQHVRSDKRVEQVMLTVREGILMVQKV